MRLPRPRLTVRRLMALVAIVALVLGGVRAREHHQRCMRIAASYAMELAFDKKSEESHQWSMEFHREDARRSRKRAERAREWAAAWRRKAEVMAIRESLGNQPGRPIDRKRLDRLGPSAKEYLERAARDLERAARDEESAAHDDKEAGTASKELALARASSQYRTRMKIKYERAAYRPWERIPPDPPPPHPIEAIRFWLDDRQYARALAACREAIQREPTDNWAYRQQAWILATCPVANHRDGKAAIEPATTACKLSEWKDPGDLATLAAAYAEDGDFAKALHWQRRAMELRPPDSPDRKGDLERLALYRAGRPCRDERYGP